MTNFSLRKRTCKPKSSFATSWSRLRNDIEPFVRIGARIAKTILYLTVSVQHTELAIKVTYDFLLKYSMDTSMTFY